VHQVGSHIILQTDTPVSHRLAVPDHTPLRVGAFHCILRAVAQTKQVEREAILKTLYPPDCAAQINHSPASPFSRLG
jgi:hypothetical protein